jgi:hypothetical protein
MILTEAKKIILENSNFSPNSFHYKLKFNHIFDKEEYFKLYEAVSTLRGYKIKENIDISDILDETLALITSILNSFEYHLDETDDFKIIGSDNLDFHKKNLIALNKFLTFKD